jgi:adenine-specific DNA-methyltransferase
MRFLGNKESMLPEIIGMLERKGLMSRSLTLYDAFCGSGAVSDALKDTFRIVAGDMLNWCVIYTNGRLCAASCTFETLGFNPFDYLNSSTETINGFFYTNYSPAESKRMYFSTENAARIDYFRETIAKWYSESRITDDEHNYLLASLIESVSDVSNTAGVYGAYLKKWDPRALKPIVFHSADYEKATNLSCVSVIGKTEDIVDSVDCDIIYIDPPYTQNQYGTQYHIFETLVLNDTPNISKITGSRPVTPMRSDWSRGYKANILFDRTIANTKAKYILFSYNSDGIMSKEFILASLKRYCVYESIDYVRIPYKKYRNFKTKSEDEHYEYLFFAQKKDTADITFESPLNYIGSKSLVIPYIKTYMPENIESFLDVFGGGLNVGVNIPANSVVYNDINLFARKLVESFRDYDTYEYLQYISKIISKFSLQAGNKEAYIAARSYYNSLPTEKRDIRLLFTIIMYGFQQQIRFNSRHEFNNPVGLRWFNDCVLEKVVSFSRVIKSKNIEFLSIDFSKVIDNIADDAFVYMDPPYRLTNGSYNDGKRGFEGWTIFHERKLRDFADLLDARGIKFMISYVLVHAGQENNEIRNWCESRGYNTIPLDEIPRRNPRKEVLITNYA